VSKNLEQVLSVKDLAELNVDVVAGFAAANIKISTSAFLNVAKAFISLDGRATADEVKALILKGGVPAEKYASARKNAQKALDVWFAVVDPGFGDETWFNSLTYHEFVMVGKAVRAVGAATLAEQGVFKKRIALAWGALEKAVESVQPPKVVAALAAPVPPVVAAPVPPVVAAPVPPVVAAPSSLPAPAPAVIDPLDPVANAETKPAEAIPVTPAPGIVEPPSPAASTPAPSAPTPIESVTVTPPASKAPVSAETAALEKLAKAEQSVLALIAVAMDEVSVGRVIERLAAMTMTIEAARDKRFPAVDVASLTSLNNQVVAAA
jgi:hypothetical protein